jgi:hypothetical protein
MKAPRLAVSKVLIATLLASTPAWAGGGGNDKDFQPLPSGIVYPDAFHASSINPAALARNHAFGALALYSPALMQEPFFDAYFPGYDASAAATFGSWGVGVVFQRAGDPAYTTSNVITPGAAFRAGRLAVGLDMAYSLSSSVYGTTNMPIDMGITYGEDSKGVSGAVKLAGITSPGSVMPTLGLGYAEEHKYTVEANLGLPTFTGLFDDFAVYRLDVGATVCAGMFGFSFGTGFSFTVAQAPSSFSGLTATFGVVAKLGKAIQLQLRHTGSSAYVGAGLVF